MSTPAPKIVLVMRAHGECANLKIEVMRYRLKAGNAEAWADKLVTAMNETYGESHHAIVLDC